VDIHLRTARSAKISGKVIDALAPDSRNGEKGGATSRTAVVSLAPRSVTVGKELAHVVEANPDGSFEFSNVPPGAYEIYARLPAPSGWGAEGPPERAKNPGAFGHTAVDARGEDIEGITINVRQGVDVKGRVFVDGIPTAANLHLSLRADETAFRVIDGDTSGAFSQVNSYEPKIAENGSFSIPLVPEGRYRLRASFGVGAREKSSNPSSAAPLPLSAYIEDVVQGGQSVYDDGLRAGPEAPEQIDVIIRTNGGSIAGDVIAADKTPRALAVVTLIPPPLRRRNGALYKTALTDERGHFEIVGVPPGEYKLLAFEFVEPGSLQNAEVLEKYESRAVAATVTTGTQTRVHVDLIPTLQ
jgi:hypothetical protein